MDTTLTPSDLFSPSKARQHRAQAHEWAAVDSWLSAKYSGRSVPTFERNDNTLKALLALSSVNERADEEIALIEKLENSVLTQLKSKAEDDFCRDVLQSMNKELSKEGLECLNSLAQTAVIVNAADSTFDNIAHQLIELTKRSSTLSEDLLEVETLRSFLEHSISTHKDSLTALRSDITLASSATLNQQTAEKIRLTKQLRPKLQEYESRVRILSAHSKTDHQARISVEELVELEKDILDSSDQTKKLKKQLESFSGFPTKIGDAQNITNGLEKEVKALRRKRDEMFEEFGS